MSVSTTKFSKGSGESSSGTIAVLDLSSLEDDLFPDLDAGHSSESNFSKFVSGFKSGFIDNFKTTRIVRNFASSALPTGFSRLIGSYDSLMSDVKEIASDLEKTNPRDLHYIARKVNRLLPSIKDYVPEGLYNLASQQLTESVEKYDYLAKEQVADFRKKKDRSSGEEANRLRLEKREQEVREALDHGSLVAKDIFNRSERSAAKREARRIATEGIREKVDRGRFDFLARTASLSADSLTRMASYNEQVDFGIKKKGLELQLRTLLEIKDLTHLHREGLKLHDEAYKAIVRNTALPDHRKKDFDKLSKVGTGTAFAGKVKGALGESLSSYLFGYRGNLKKNVKKSLGGKLGELVNLARQGDQAAAIGLKDLWDTRYETAGGFAGEGAANFLTNYIIPEIGSRIRPELEKFGDQYLGGKQHKTAYILDNIPSLLREFASSQRESGIGGFFKNQARDFLDPLLPVFGRRTRIEEGGLSNITEMAAFNEMTQRSIVDVIPGYLSRILHEIRVLRTGDEELDREVYDITAGKFTGYSAAKSNLLNRLITPNETAHTSSAIGKLLAELDEEGKLSDKAQDALTAKFLREAGMNKAFNPESYLTRSGLEGVDQETYEEIKNFFKGKFKFTDKGKMIDSTENLKLRQELSESFNSIKHSVADPSELIFKLIESGNTEMLRETGIIYSKGGQDFLNYDEIWKILAKDAKGSAKDSRHYKNLFGRFRYTDEEQEAADLAEKRQAAVDKWKERGKRLIDFSEDNISDLRGQASERLKQSVDIFSAGNNTPLIKAADLAEGTLFDLKTGKVITNYLDIKGTVVNKDGLIVISNLDIARGLYTQTGQRLDLNPTKFDTPSSHKPAGYVPGYNDPSGTTFDLNSVDWYIQGSPEPAIEINKLKSGMYYDESGSVLKDVEDIKGTVYDSSGNVVVSEDDYKAGLWNKRNNHKLSPSGRGSRNTSKVIGAVDTFFRTDTTTLINRGIAKLLRIGVGMGISAFNSASTNRDGYLPQESEPIITAKKLKEGHYVSEKGKVIESFTLHKGPIYDREGNLLVSDEEAPQLLNIDGTKHAIASNYGVIGTVRRWGKKYVNWSIGYFKWAGRKTLDFWKGVGKRTPFVKGFFNKGEIALRRAAGDFSDVDVPSYDAYLDGKPEPILTRKALINGEYFNSDGSVIKFFHKHKGEIFDREGNVLVSKDELQRLKNPDGSKHDLAKKKSLVGRTVGAIGRQMGRNLKTLGNVWKGVGKRIPLLGRLFRSKSLPAATILARAQSQGQEVSTESTLLASILDVLRAQEPEKVRKGSWQDQAQRAKDKLFNKKDDSKYPKGMDGLTKGIFSSITKGLGGLLGLGKKDKGEEEDDGDSYGFTDLIRDALLGKAAAGDKGKGKNRKPKKGGGRFSKIFNKVPKGKVGTWATRGLTALRAVPFVGGALSSMAGLATGIATSAAAIVTAPLVLKGALIAAVGYGLWKTYKYADALATVSKDFIQLRMMQYGFDSTMQEVKILELEKFLDKFTNKSVNNSQLVINADALEHIAKLFDINLAKEKDGPKLKALVEFIEYRFKPVYLAWMNSLEQMQLSNIKLTEIDDKLSNDRKLELLDLIEKSETNINYETPTPNPFKIKKVLKVEPKRIEAQKAKIRKNVEKKAKIKSTSKEIPLSELKPVYAGVNLTKDNKSVDTGSKETPRKQTFGEAVRVKRAKELGTPKMVVGNSSYVMGKFSITGKIPGFTAIRLRAYGAELFDEATIYALLGLESMCLPYLHVGQGGKVDASKSYHLIIEKARWLLGARAKDERSYEWLRERFIPTLTTYYAVCTEMGYDPKRTNIFRDTAKVKIMAERIMGAVDEHGNSVWDAYNIFQSKLGNYELRQLAEMELAELEKNGKYPVPSEGLGMSKQQSLLGRGFEGFKNLAQSVADKAKGIASFIGNAAKSTASAVGSFASRAASAVGNMFSGGGDAYSQEVEEKPTSGGGSSQLSVPNSKLASGPIHGGDPNLTGISFGKGVDASHVHNLNPEVFKLFTGMAKEYNQLTGKNITVNEAFRSRAKQEALFRKYGKGRAAEPGSSLHEFGLAIDINSVDVKALNSLGLLKKYGFTAPVGGETWHIEPAGIATNPKEAKGNVNLANKLTAESIGRGGLGYAYTQGNLKYRRNIDLQKKIFGDKPVSGLELLTYSNQEKSNGETVDSKVTGGVGSYGGGNFASRAASDGGGNFASRAASAAGNMFSGGGNAGGGGPVGVMKDPIEVSFTEGNGGGWESIPKPNANKSAAAARPVFEAVGKLTGVDPLALHVFAGLESNYDYLAVPMSKGRLLSSAVGWFQFLNKTWDEMLRKYGARFGVPPDDANRSLRKDPRLNALMGAMFLIENRDRLRKSLGREPNLTDLYCAHFMGAGGASKFLRAMGPNPNAIGATAMPAEAKSNPGVYYANGRPRTFLEIYQSFERRMQPFIASFDKSYNGSTETAKEADPDEVKVMEGEEVADLATKGEDSGTSDGGKIVTADSEDSPLKSGETSESLKATAHDVKISPDGLTASKSGTPTVDNVPQPESDVNVTPIESQVQTTSSSLSKADIADRTSQVRGNTVQESVKELVALINIQERQLEAVMGIRSDLSELLMLKRAPTAESVNSPTPPQANVMTSRSLASYDGFLKP